LQTKQSLAELGAALSMICTEYDKLEKKMRTSKGQGWNNGSQKLNQIRSQLVAS